jgi:hypothetical protein
MQLAYLQSGILVFDGGWKKKEKKRKTAGQALVAARYPTS